MITNEHMYEQAAIRFNNNLYMQHLSREINRDENGNQFIDTLNDLIELRVYANGNEDRDCAIDILKEHLATFNVCTMHVSKENYYEILRMQEEYGVKVD